MPVPLSYAPAARALAIGLAAALLFEWLNAPLPWMIGPLFVTAAARMAGIELQSPNAQRLAGQWVIGTALGLYFTPAVLAVLAEFAAYIAAGIVFALILGALCAWLLARLSGVDRTTAYFAMAIGGASEMLTQSERYGARSEWVAAAHGVRMLMVVAVIPFLFHFAGLRGSDPFLPAVLEVRWLPLSLLMLATSGAALGLMRLGTPNAWVIVPLLLTAGLTANGFELSALPRWMVTVGQLFIGISLGTRFSPDFVKTAPRFLASAACCITLAMLLSSVFALGIAELSGMHPATAVLATSPGGIAEMSLTAKTLQLGVPLVTAFQACRMVGMVLLVGPVFGLATRR